MIIAKSFPPLGTRIPRTSSSVSYLLLLLLAASPRLGAQESGEPVPSPPPDVRPELVAPFGAEISVNEVLLDVLVTDKKGNVILGLGPADFLVTEGDRKVEVLSAAFYSSRPYLGPETPAAGTVPPVAQLAPVAPVAPVAPMAPVAPVAPNEPLPTDPPRYFIFLFDDQRGHNADAPGLLQRQVKAGRDATEWVRSGLAPNDWVAVLAYDNRLELFQDFSQDRAAISSAIENATTGRADRGNFPSRQAPTRPGQPSLAGRLPTGEALSAETGTIYEALTLVAEAAAPLLGRKNLLLFTIGFGRMNRYLQYEPDPRYFEPMSESLNDANVAVYTFDLTDTGTRHPFSNAMNHISTDTGGRYFENALHFKGPLADVAREASGYYLVSYRSEHVVGMRGFQRVKVALANPELKITARKGYRFGE
jgi:VWFA-related protein